MYHLRDADDIVVAATYETNQSFPRILLQIAHSSEFGGLVLEI